MKNQKTQTGKIANSVGFNSNGGSSIRKDQKAIIREQKRNGLTPISFDPSTGVMKYL